MKSERYDYLAPDTSEVRLLLTEKDTAAGSMAHCALPPGKTSIACMHKSVSELWYFLAGEGELWLKNSNMETISKVSSGSSISIPAETMFQFRNLSQEVSLEFLVTTFPFWPGADEAVEVEGKWFVV